MEMNSIITIGREFGSGGREIGEKLAESFGIKCYDKELLAAAAKESGLCQEIFAVHDERPTNSFLYSLVMNTYSLGYVSNPYIDMPLDQRVFLAQFDAIKKLANQGPCVIVGRCADYALCDYPNCISIFIHAPLEDRVKSISAKNNIGEGAAKDLILKTDKKRASYYNFYSNKKWGVSSSYDLSVNSSVLGINGTIEYIKKFVEMKEGRNQGSTKLG